MINTVSVNNIQDVFAICNNQIFDKKINRFRSPYLYRGLPNINYTLQTSLQRNCKSLQHNLENSILRNFSKYASLEDPDLKKSIWRQLIVGQHHGLPTRLLDWTYSPLIALNFATSQDDLNSLEKNDCVLWKIDITELHNLLPEKYKQILRTECAYLFTVDMLKNISLSEYDLDMLNKSLILLEPPSIDQRIINQYSYFTVIPSKISNIETFLDSYTQNTEKYIISKQLKWQIRDLLDQFNINERIMFPGLDGLSMWLKRHYFVREN